MYKSRGQMSTTEVRKRREEQQVEIRRQRREENVAKRRNLFASADGPDSDDEGAIEWEVQVGLVFNTIGVLPCTSVHSLSSMWINNDANGLFL